ncbi:MAG: hypothetical protein ABSG87_04705 [Verrucomicrobiota bacterium]|jgi:hypothetical protein
MKELLAAGWALGFISMMITLPTFFGYSRKITNILKLKYPEVWVSLGRPRPFSNSIQTSLTFKEFIKNPNAYVKDDEISVLASKVIILKRIHFCAFFITIACFILAIASNHPRSR